MMFELRRTSVSLTKTTKQNMMRWPVVSMDHISGSKAESDSRKLSWNGTLKALKT